MWNPQKVQVLLYYTDVTVATSLKDSHSGAQIDEFFVTPLVATQSINLILETCVPRLLKVVEILKS